jgi:hypothetical protein
LDIAVLKELVDNAADNAEEIGRQPEVTITVAEDGIIVTDKGSGIEPATVKGIVDLDSRMSNRSLYRTTTRGSQGNAWPTILGFAYNWERLRRLQRCNGLQFMLCRTSSKKAGNGLQTIGR